MWTEQHRKTYARVGGRYPSDMTDAEWALLEPLIPPAKPGGRPRETDMREAINAILYLLRTGCPWRYLPRDGFPPRSTVYNIFRNLTCHCKVPPWGFKSGLVKDGPMKRARFTEEQIIGVLKEHESRPRPPISLASMASRKRRCTIGSRSTGGMDVSRGQAPEGLGRRGTRG